MENKYLKLNAPIVGFIESIGAAELLIIMLPILAIIIMVFYYINKNSNNKN